MAPKVSVVIATHNKLERLNLVLKSLALQREKNFEVHVINDGGNPATGQLVDEFTDRLDVSYAWTRHEGAEPQGAAATRNVGIRKARADRLLIVDDDCVCPNDVVGTHAGLGGTPMSYVGFRINVAQETVPTITDWHLEDVKKRIPGKFEMRTQPGHDANFRKYARANSWLIQCYLWTCHISYPTAMCRNVGGMWEEMKGSGAEDCEFGLRMWRAGCRYKILDDPSVWHLDHPWSPLQEKYIEANRQLFYKTRDDRTVVVRNGGRL